MERIRKELGPDAVILSNRRSGSTGRVEIIAAAPGEVRALVDDFVPAKAAPRRREPAPIGAAVQTRAAVPARTAPESFQEFLRRQGSTARPIAPREDVLAMYRTLAQEGEGGAGVEAPPRQPRALAPADVPAVFRRRPARQDAAPPHATVAAPPVRDPDLAEGWARPAPLAGREERRHNWMTVQPVAGQAAPAAQPPMASAAALAQMPVAPMVPQSAPLQPAQVAPPLAAPAAPVVAAAVAATVAPAAPPAEAAAAPPDVVVPSFLRQPPAPPLAAAAAPALDAGVMAELQALRSALTDRISHLEQQIAPAAAPPPPAARPVVAPAAVSLALLIKRQAMTRLLMSGFSPELARRLAEAVPPDLDGKQVEPWLQNNLAQQLRCPAEAQSVLEQPGAVALVGPTGVGKTTTVAKLAARFVVRHGAAALGLITLDSYRMGAHEQLRAYGRILGVPVQVAHDGASLRDLLAAMHGKRKVLIDTCGMSQRDQRLGEMLGMLAEARFAAQEVPRVLLLNAASHAETLDEVARAWRVSGAHGAILTKMDEAARIGGGLDALIRYQLPLLGLTNGQRVPEDWHPGNAGLLAHIALKPFGAAFALDSAEIQSLTSTGVALV
jgi:flagellar biosynthesis protein FlhF